MKLGVGVVVATVAFTTVLSLRTVRAQTPPADDSAPSADSAAPPANVPAPPPPDLAPPPPDLAPPTPDAAPPAPNAAQPSASHPGLGALLIPGATVISRCPHCETSPRRFLSFAIGLGGVSRIDDVPPTRGYSFRVQFGQRLAHRLHLVEETNTLEGQEYVSPSPTDTSENHISLGAGLRWMLSEPRPVLNPAHFPGPFLDLNAFYVTAILGADARSRATWVSPTQSTYQSAWSPMASVALGASPIRGHDWSLSEEFREQLAYYDGHVQRSWMALFVAELEQW